MQESGGATADAGPGSCQRLKGSFNNGSRPHAAMVNPIQPDESDSQQHRAQWGVVNIYTKSLSSAHGWCLPATSVSNVVLHILSFESPSPKL